MREFATCICSKDQSGFTRSVNAIRRFSTIIAVIMNGKLLHYGSWLQCHREAGLDFAWRGVLWKGQRRAYLTPLFARKSCADVCCHKIRILKGYIVFCVEKCQTETFHPVWVPFFYPGNFRPLELIFRLPCSTGEHCNSTQVKAINITINCLMTPSELFHKNGNCNITLPTAHPSSNVPKRV